MKEENNTLNKYLSNSENIQIAIKKKATKKNQTEVE